MQDRLEHRKRSPQQGLVLCAAVKAGLVSQLARRLRAVKAVGPEAALLCAAQCLGLLPNKVRSKGGIALLLLADLQTANVGMQPGQLSICL